MALFKRILEVDSRFIPQQWSLVSGWYSLSKSSGFKWKSLECQLDYCSYDSLEEARLFFEAFKPKIHKV